MALQSRVTERVGAESLEEPWQEVGAGGFGNVFKARHKKWRFDVAIKLLRDGVGILEEASIMDLASCDFVLRMYGIFEGCPPGRTIQKGIVMEFMPRGSVQTLQNSLSGPPPWPLTFRLAHEVALGMNFLHSKNLMHSDLKASNVLLNNDLHAKLADFGLSRVSTSAVINDREPSGELGGSYKYIPPEAFDLSYKPVRSFDVYSYGILLWSIVAGKEPYEFVDRCLVALRIPQGDRPSLDEVDHTGPEGSKELFELMERCWDGEPTKRPSFRDCLDKTELVFSKHQNSVTEAVSQVLAQLVKPDIAALTLETSSSRDNVEKVTTEKSHQELVKGMSHTDKAKFVDDHRAKLIQKMSEVMAVVEQLGDMVPSETYSVIESKPTSQDKMRALYQGSLRPGGEKVKAAFYDILSKDYPHLVTSLGGEL